MNTEQSPLILLPRVLLLGLALAGAAGCATVVKGSHQKVPIASAPPGAEVIVDGVEVGKTPLSMQMKRKVNHLVTIQKPGYRPQSVAVVMDVGGAVWGNVIAGGLIGWGVDASTGAQYNLTPKTISVTLESATAAVDSFMGQDEPGLFVDKLKALDALKENKQISDEDYGKARLALFRQYMPESLPEEARQVPPPE